MGQSEPEIPVTVLSGYLGAGKTTLVNHVLSNQQGYSVAVIVNDMGEINIDADLIARENDEEGIVDLSNGCICCRLQGDLLAEAQRLTELREFDYLLVESSGISEPIPVAKVFLEGTEDSDVDPTELFRLDTMVTVLDTYGFWKEFDADEPLPGDGSDAERPLSEVFVEGIEFCDVLLLNKCDMVPEDELDEIEAVVAELQPRAERIRTTYSDVDPDVVLGTGRFDFAEAKRSQGWKRHLAKEGADDHAAHGEGEGDGDGHTHTHGPGQHAADRHGVSSFVYRSERPFHPERFADWIEEWGGDVVRSKGVCSVADRAEVIGMSQAGPAVQAGPIGEWGPDDERRTRLVFIGRGMDEAEIRGALDACLLEEGESADVETDPFPLRVE
jgi:G3E family GTPase